MSTVGILKPAQINVQQALDIVQLCLGTDKIRLYYQTTFKICSNIAGAAKFAMRHEGVRPAQWNELAKYDRAHCNVRLHKEYRRSNHRTNIENWAVSFEGSLVVLTFDDQFYKMHYSDAAIVQVWLRKAAKQAKNWAGDNGRIWTTYARLTDAEENDKVLYA